MWLQTRTIAAKLVAAFGLCACITVAVGGLGKLEVSGTHRALQQVLTDDLLSITRANDVRSNVIAHIRDAYRLIGLVAMQASADERNDARASMLENQGQVEDLFAEYQATPQSPGEREQATAFEAAWGATPPPLSAQPPSWMQAMRRPPSWCWIVMPSRHTGARPMR